MAAPPLWTRGTSAKYRRPRSRNTTGDCDCDAWISKPLASYGVAGQIVISPGTVVNHCSPAFEWPNAPPPEPLSEIGPPPPEPDFMRNSIGQFQSPKDW